MDGIVDGMLESTLIHSESSYVPCSARAVVACASDVFVVREAHTPRLPFGGHVDDEATAIVCVIPTCCVQGCLDRVGTCAGQCMRACLIFQARSPTPRTVCKDTS